MCILHVCVMKSIRPHFQVQGALWILKLLSCLSINKFPKPAVIVPGLISRFYSTTITILKRLAHRDIENCYTNESWYELYLDCSLNIWELDHNMPILTETVCYTVKELRSRYTLKMHTCDVACLYHCHATIPWLHFILEPYSNLR